MKDLKEFILEANSKIDQWIAVSVTTAPDSYHSKETTTQRVVSVETYNDLKNGRTKGYMTVSNVTALGPVCKTKEQAMEYLDITPKKVKKGKIDKGNADYIVYAISSGKMNPTGTTKWDWNFWEEWKDGEIYIDRRGDCFLMGAPGSLKVGDKVFCVDNDSLRKLTGSPTEIKAVCKCTLEDFRNEYRKVFSDRCKRPYISFGRRIDGLPWQRMGQFYSIKGVAEEA